MLYVLIMYCSGICPGWIHPPSGVLFYSNLSECEAKIAESPRLLTMGGIGPDGKEVQGIRLEQTCATMYAEPKQLDRIIDPTQLVQLLKDYNIDRKAHPVCTAHLKGKCQRHDPEQPGDPCNGGTVCIADVANITSVGACRGGEIYTWVGETLMCENPDTGKRAPPCDKPFGGRCAVDARKRP